MACPHVSGAAALVLKANPNIKSSAVLQELQDTAAANYVSGLYSTDASKLLNVAASGRVCVGCKLAEAGAGLGLACGAQGQI